MPSSRAARRRTPVPASARTSFHKGGPLRGPAGSPCTSAVRRTLVRLGYEGCLRGVRPGREAPGRRSRRSPGFRGLTGEPLGDALAPDYAPGGSRIGRPGYGHDPQTRRKGGVRHARARSHSSQRPRPDPRRRIPQDGAPVMAAALCTVSLRSSIAADSSYPTTCSTRIPGMRIGRMAPPATLLTAEDGWKPVCRVLWNR